MISPVVGVVLTVGWEMTLVFISGSMSMFLMASGRMYMQLMSAKESPIP